MFLCLSSFVSFSFFFFWSSLMMYVGWDACVAAQEWTNRTLAVHERVDSRFLVLLGSESTITEITEFIYFSPLKPCREFKYKSEPVILIIEPILFLWNIIFTFYYTRVRPQCDYSILGRWGSCSVLCRMYERGKGVVREWLCQPGLSRAPRLGFQTRMLKLYLHHVLWHDFSYVVTSLREKKRRQTSEILFAEVAPPPHWGAQG